MKILIQGYNSCNQNVAGGVSRRISCFSEALRNNGVENKIFNYWEDKVKDYDLVHFFKLQMDHFGLMQYLRAEKIPYAISTIHPIERIKRIQFNNFLYRNKIRTISGLGRVMLNNSSLIFTQSSAEKLFLQKAYNLEHNNIFSIPNGFQADIASGKKTLINGKYNIDKNVVICVGRIDPNKNQLNLIRAFKEIDLTLIIIGGPDNNYIEYYNQCVKEATDNVIFAGWIPPNDELLKSAYDSAKVVVLPSYSETFGNVILEGALSNANVCFSKYLPICDYGIDKYSYTFDPSNISDIKNSIIQAYQNDVNPALREYVKQTFSWDKVTKKHIELYRTVINGTQK